MLTKVGRPSTTLFAYAERTRLTCIVILLVLSNFLLSVGRTSRRAAVSHGEPPLVTDTSIFGLVIGAGEFSGAVDFGKHRAALRLFEEHETLAWLCHRSFS
jgi:hypothetical protein